MGRRTARLLKWIQEGGVIAANAALWFLAWLPGYAKVPKDALLRHDARAAIMDKVREDPGITVAELSGELGIPYNTVDYHLGRLVREGLATPTLNGKHKHVFPPTVPPADQKGLATLRNANTIRLLEAIRSRPGSHQRALAAAIEVQPTSLAWHLARLHENGLIRSTRAGRTVVWFTSEEADRRAA